MERIGVGGTGEVWEAVLHGPRGFRRSVALKVLARQADGEQALVDEARLGALLHHPNVVGTTELGESEGVWYVAMELVRGASLAEIAQQGPLEAAALLEVGIQACAGLHAAHTLEVDGRPTPVIHRDVKPGNLLVDALGWVKVADLGIARFAGTPGAAAGTPGYVPREQLDGDALDARTDVFGLGASLFALGTGERAFGRGPAALEAVRATEQVLGPDRMARLDRVAPGIAAIVYRCLRTRAEDRWPDIASLGAALTAVRARHGGGPTLRDRVAALRGKLPASFGAPPPPAEIPTLVQPAGNLPEERDAFVGRDPSVARIRDAVAAHRLVTLVGQGGAGKSRLALHVARSVTPSMQGRAWFFDVSQATTTDGLCFVLAQALGAELSPSDPAGSVGFALRGLGRVLVVLDNLEQAAEAAAGLVDRWLTEAPDARFLGTSRTPLRLRGEHRVPIGPMSTAEGAALFRARAPVELPPEQEPQIRALVDALDALPLAVELAAARTRVLSVAAIALRLGEALDLAGDGARDRPARHRTLRASLDASRALLPPEVAGFLAAAAVFEGPFTLEAAEAVLGGRALDRLEALVDASLVRVEADTGRFSLLGLVRTWAAEQLPAEQLAIALRRHGAWIASAGTEDALAALDGAGGLARWRVLAACTADGIAACRRAIARGDGRTAAAAALAVSAVLGRTGPFETEAELLRAVLPIAPPDRLHRILTRLALVVHTLGGDPEPILLRAAEAARFPSETAGVRRTVGQIRAQQGRFDEARAALAEAIAIGGDHPPTVLAARSSLAFVALTTGDLDAADREVAAAEALADRLDDDRMRAHVWATAGGVAYERGDPAAVDLLTRSMVLSESMGAWADAARSAGNLAHVLYGRGEVDAMPRLLLRSLAHATRAGSPRGAAIAISNLGVVYNARGRPADAIACFATQVERYLALDDPRILAIAIGNLGLALWTIDRRADALRCTHEAVRRCRALGVPSKLAPFLAALAPMLEAEGQLAPALAVVEERRALAVGDGHPAELAWLRLSVAVGRLSRAEALARVGDDPSLDGCFTRYRLLPTDEARRAVVAVARRTDGVDARIVLRILGEPLPAPTYLAPLPPGVPPTPDLGRLLERLG